MRLNGFKAHVTLDFRAPALRIEQRIDCNCSGAPFVGGSEPLLK